MPSNKGGEANFLSRARVDALLDTISWCEGTDGPDGYRTMFTHKLFDDFSDHPRQIQSGGGFQSDAAGKWQFLSSTWDECAEFLNLRDFSPESQRKAATYLIQRRGCLPQIHKGMIGVALPELAKEWASLPYSPYGQPTKTLEEFMHQYRLYLGDYLGD